MSSLTALALRRPWALIAATLFIAIVAGIFGSSVSDSLLAGGQQDPNAESSQAARLLEAKFDISDQVMVLVLTSDTDARSTPTVRAVADDITSQLNQSAFVENVTSAWALPPAAADAMFSRDGKSGIITAGLRGGEDHAPKHAAALIEQIGGSRGGVQIRAGGQPVLYSQIVPQMKQDLVVMESIALPLSFLALIWIFGGLYAALLPLGVGITAVVGSMAVLKAVTCLTEVSSFALNLTVAMGLALAIDYSLLLISRYREEVAGGRSRDEAIVVATHQSGRTIAFSAITIAVALSALLLFPMYFLKSFAYAGVGVVVLSALITLLAVPAALKLLGGRIDKYDIRSRFRRQQKLVPRPITASRWYHNTKRVMRQAVPVTLVIVAGLLGLGAPFLELKLGFPDDRVLPASASARQVGDLLREEFPSGLNTQLSAILIPAPDDAELDRYASAISAVPNVKSVSAPNGLYMSGNPSGPPVAATGRAGGAALLTIDTRVIPGATDADDQLAALRATPPPAGSRLLLSGLAQIQRDNVHGVTSRIPLVLSLMAVTSLVLMFALTRSVLLPVKALVLNVLSLSATFGALVWIFQQGHLGGLGTQAVGTIAVSTPILLFCIAFGLSMDYEVFLMARIREYWLDSDRTRADSDEAVALGVARTGPIITAAALIMCVSFAALTAAQVSFIRAFGLGLTLAIAMDATVVRMLLVPASMRLFGKANWWAPLRKRPR